MTVVSLGLLTAMVVVLQIISATMGIKFGTFTISLCLAPIIIGAALFGWKSGAWLGFVFGVVVLLTGDAAAFFTINAPGTIITVLAKGALSGAAAGLVYTLISKKNKTVADFTSVLISGIVAPVVNTGVFLLGCRIFFYDTLAEWGAGFGFENTFLYMILGLVGLNFLVELAINFVLAAAIVYIIRVVTIIIKHAK